MIRNTLKLITLFIFLGAKSAISAVSVYPMEVTIGKEGAAELKVISQSTSPAFIKVSVKRIVNPGTNNEREVDADFTHEDSVVTTPPKLIIPAGGERSIKVVSLSAPVNEGTWRVYVEEVSASEFSNTKNQSDIEANVGVNITWGVLLHVLPVVEKKELRIAESKKEIVNTGSVRVTIDSIEECKASQVCSWHALNRPTIYPGERISVPNMNFKNGYKYRAKVIQVVSRKTETIDLNQ